MAATLGTLYAHLKVMGYPQAQLASDNPTLLAREVCFETDTSVLVNGTRVYKIKVGPGEWNTLPYASMGPSGLDIATVTAMIATHAAATDPHGDRAYTDTQIAALGTAAQADTGTAAGDVPVLGAGGVLPVSTLPALAITDTYEVASQVAMLALTAERGDIAIRTDLNKCFVLAAEPASTLANWKELKTPTDAVLAVAGLTGSITAAALKAALATTLADVLAAGNTSGANDLVLSQMLRFVYGGRNAEVSAMGITADRSYFLPDKSGMFALTSDVAQKANNLVTINTQSGTSYTMVLADAGPDHLLRQTAATATTCTIPPNSSVAYPVGTVLSGVQAGAGQVTLTPGSGVTLNSRGGALKTAGQYAPWTAIQVATDTWLVSGDLTT